MPPATDASQRIAATVSAALREAGITQQRAARRSGIALATLERRLSGVGKPFDTDELERIADVLGLSIFDLIYRAEGAA
jgi:transcriptional regulator with XRE-family HTH domain